MRTRYTIVENEDYEAYEAKELKEHIRSIADAIDFIIGVSGDYKAALEFLKEHNIKTRLSDDEVEAVGLPLLAELREIRVAMELQLPD